MLQNGIISNQQCGIGGIGGAVLGGYQNCYTWPYPSQQVHHYWQYAAEPVFPFKIRRAENGFVLVEDGKEFVFEGAESLLKSLKERLKKNGV